MFSSLVGTSEENVRRAIRIAEGVAPCVLWVDEMTQRGLNSRFAPRGRYSWQEETLVQFNRWLVKRYRSHWPTNGA